MERIERQRVNLYLEKELVDFAKKWSYVTGKPFSHLIDEYLRHLRGDILYMEPEDWFLKEFDPEKLSREDLQKFIKDENDYYDKIINDKKEEEYCRKNPDSTRARTRALLIKEIMSKQEEDIKKYQEEEKQRNKLKEEFCNKWKEVFPHKK